MVTMTKSKLRQEGWKRTPCNEWDEGEFQLEPRWIREEGQTAADGVGRALIYATRRAVAGVDGQQQRVENQRKRQIEHGQVAPCGIPHIPFHARIILISVAPAQNSATDDAAAAASRHAIRRR